MKQLLFIVLIVICPSLAFGKKEGRSLIDSLLQEIKTAKHDTDKVKMLNKVSFNYRMINGDSTVLYGKQALNLAQEAGFKSGIAMAYKCIGTGYIVKDDPDKALEFKIKSLEIYEELKNDYFISRGFGEVGAVYYQQKSYAKALDYMGKAVEQASRNGDKIAVADNSYNMGCIYQLLGNYEKALERELLAFKMYGEIHININEARVLTGIGNAYLGQKKYDSALSNFLRSLEICKAANNEYDYANNIGNIGTAYYSMAADSPLQTKAGYNATGKAANLKKAIFYLDSAVVMYRKNGDKDALMEFSLTLSKALSEAGRYKDALDIFREYSNVKDSVFSNDKRLGFAAQETKRETGLKEKQIQINVLAMQEKRNERIIFIIGLALLGLTVAVVYSYFKAQKRTNAIQRETLRQKEILMKEVHHRVKNNLQVVGTLLDLQLNTVSDEIARQAIKESGSRLKAMSLIHQQLYQQDNITQIECSNFANYLHAQLNAIFNKKGMEITWNNKIPPTILDIDTAVPLGLIINELITNSYKYAFSGSTGSIDVWLKQEIDGYKFFYRDSGPGLPTGVTTANLKSLGMLIIKSLSKQIGGAFTYLPEERTFVVAFKDSAGMKVNA